MGNALTKISKFYALVFLLMSVLATFSSAIWIYGLLKSQMAVANQNEDFYRAVSFLIVAASFFVWWRIFYQVSNLLRGKAEFFDRSLLKRLSFLLFLAFAIDLAYTIFAGSFIASTNELDSIQMPSEDVAWYYQAFHWYQYSLKILKIWGHFLEPSTAGLSTLFVAALVYLISTSKVTPAPR